MQIFEEKLGKEKQDSGRAQEAAMRELHTAQACIQELEGRLQEATASAESRLLRAKADAELDRERQASRAGDLETRIAEIEAQWQAEHAKANLQVSKLMVCSPHRAAVNIEAFPARTDQS